MANSPPYGRVLCGDPNTMAEAWQRFQNQPVDLDIPKEDARESPKEAQTLGTEATVSGLGTFFGKAYRTLKVKPPDEPGWWFDRTDLADTLPVRVSIHNVWTTGSVVSNIVLRSGPPGNYVRMVEHMIALKLGLGIDDCLIQLESGDPPLFNNGSLALVEALESAGIQSAGRPATYWTVKEPVTVCGARGQFLSLHPAQEGDPALNVDCAIDFPNAIGQQRVRFPVSYDLFRWGCQARTNTNLWKMVYCKTIGKLFADIRNLGYNRKNILIAGRNRYMNEPQLNHHGKSLEAVWHRATLDLLAAIALVGRGRFAGRIYSYKCGHHLDVAMIREIYRRHLLVPHQPRAAKAETSPS